MVHSSSVSILWKIKKMQRLSFVGYLLLDRCVNKHDMLENDKENMRSKLRIISSIMLRKLSSGK